MAEKKVFINCPFDDDYKALLQTILFTCRELGYTPQLTTLEKNSIVTRIKTIENMIKEANFSIHDISRYSTPKKSTNEDSDHSTSYSRLNMPFELGIDFGFHLDKKHKMLVLCDSEHAWKPAFSDFSAYDVKSHDNKPECLIQLLYGFRKEDARGNLTKNKTDFDVWLQQELVKDGHEPEDTENILLEMADSNYILYIDDWLKAKNSGDNQ